MRVRGGSDLRGDHAGDVDVVQPPAVVMGRIAPPRAELVVRIGMTVQAPGLGDPADPDPLSEEAVQVEFRLGPHAGAARVDRAARASEGLGGPRTTGAAAVPQAFAGKHIVSCTPRGSGGAEPVSVGVFSQYCDPKLLQARIFLS